MLLSVRQHNVAPHRVELLDCTAYFVARKVESNAISEGKIRFMCLMCPL